MARSYYIHDEQTGSPLLRRFLILLLVLALAGGMGVGLYIYMSDRQAGEILDQYKQSLQAGEYGTAIGLYRETQEKALALGPFDRNQTKYKAALAAMEILTDGRLQELENKLLQAEALSGDDLDFASDMAEVSAVRLIAFLRGICADFLVGKTSRPILENAFNQLAALDNLYDAVGGLPAEFDRMEAAQPRMIAALVDLDSQAYWSCYHALQAVLADGNLAGFVRDQASLHLEACKKAMLQPLLDTVHQQMAGGRYLTAQNALLNLSEAFPDNQTIRDDLASCKTLVPGQLVNYQGAIEIISIKPLIVSPERAFDGDTYAAAANDSMMTVSEFTAMLAQLYANNYILIDSSRIYTADRQLAPLQLPPGKKPLILVLEGLNYYASRRATGNCWDLVLDEGGEVSAEYPDANNQMVVDRKGEAIGILDEFVKANPDFSLDGAKGTISLTGYECIFGTVTDADQLDDRNKALQDNGMATINLTAAEIAANRDKVLAIIDRLKSTGWLFASSTYGFIDVRSQNLDRIQADTEKWLAQVGSLTGPVSFLNYPNGAFLTGSDERTTWLKSQGFVLFGGLGTTAYLYAGKDYIYIDKTPINGFTLRNNQTYQLSRLFEINKVYDKAARPK